MRIILVTDPPWIPSANSKQMAELAHRLQEDLHTVYWMPVYGFSDGGLLEWENIAILPGDENRGNHIVKFHVVSTGAQLVITRGSAANFPEYGGSDFAWWAWHPGAIDRSILRKSTRIIGVSQQECEKLEKISGVTPFYCPRGVPRVYTNHLEDPTAVDTFRKNHGISEDEFLFSVIGTNDPHWTRMLEAFKKFRDRHDNVRLYLHTDMMRPLDLLAYCRTIGLSQKALALPNAYDHHLGYLDVTIAAMYHASRVHLVPGAALQPLVESLACGTPILTTDRPEVREIIDIEGLGALVPPVTMQEDVPLLDVEGWVEEMENAYTMGDRRAWADHGACCQMVVRDNHWDKVYAEYWKPWLATFEKEEDERIAAPTIPWANFDDKRGSSLVQDLGLVEEFGCEVVRKTGIVGGAQAERELNEVVRSWGSHPNIIPILRDGEDEYGRYYFDTPKLAPLRHVHDFTPEQADKILADIRAGLEFIHDHGAAHCDINPRNILLTDTKVTKEVVTCPLCELDHPVWEMGPDMGAVIFDFDFMQTGLTREEAYLCDYNPLDQRVIKYAVPVMRSGLATRGFHRVVTHVHNLDFYHSHATAKPDMPYQQIDGVGERDCNERWVMLHPDVAGKRVVDLGCNLGYFANRALEEGAASVLAVDRDKAIVSAARTIYPSLDGNCVEMNLDKELPAGDFDVAFCLSIWQHLRDGRRPLLEWLKKIPVTYWEDTNFTKPDLEAQGFKVERLARSERGRNLFKLEPKEKVGVEGH